MDSAVKSWLSGLYKLSGQSYLVFFVFLMLAPFIAPVLFHSDKITKLINCAPMLCIILWQLALNHCMSEGRYFKPFQTVFISLVVLGTLSLNLLSVNIPNEMQGLIQFFIWVILLATQIRTSVSISQHIGSNDFSDTTLAVLFKIWMFPLCIISLQNKLHETDNLHTQSANISAI